MNRRRINSSQSLSRRRRSDSQYIDLATTSQGSHNSNEYNQHQWKKAIKSYTDISNIAVEKRNVMVLDYLQNKGFGKIAETFLKETKINHRYLSPYKSERASLQSLIVKGELDSAIEMVNKHFPSVIEQNPSIIFHLSHQKLIEMVRNRSEITKLIEFAQQNLADLSVDDTNLLEEMEKTLALAIFDEPNECPFAYLLSQTQRQNTAMYINDAILAHQGNKSTPNLVGMIETMLTMQKDLENCKINAPKIKNIKKCEFVD